jgi:hypothetical protein
MNNFGFDDTTVPESRPNALDDTDPESSNNMINEISGRSEPPRPGWQLANPFPRFYAQALPQNQDNPPDSVSGNGKSHASEPQSNLFNTEEFGRICFETWDLANYSAFEQSTANLNDPCSS